MSARPSSSYLVRPSLLTRIFAAFGWLIYALLVAITDRAERIYERAGRPGWGDVLGGVLFLPIAVGIVLSLSLGKTALLRLVALLPW